MRYCVCLGRDYNLQSGAKDQGGRWGWGWGECLYDFKASLFYIVSSRPAKATCETLSQIKEKKPHQKIFIGMKAFKRKPERILLYSFVHPEDKEKPKVY